ncbi:MAG: HAD-IG family 5'-nucleotidase [Pseudomonadota bacterium]
MSSASKRSPSRTFIQLLNLFEPQTIRFNQRVFVNRNLRLPKICAVGFDMDYTLAVYTQDFERLAWELTLDTLIRDHGFPDAVRAFEYDPGFAIRGLIIDMGHGNIFKLDRHRHVGRAIHGTRPVGAQRRKTLYRRSPIIPSRRSYFQVDTLFSLTEAHLYAQYVDLMDQAPGRRLMQEYIDAYQAIRSSIDAVHRGGGELKRQVVANPARYLLLDPELAATLEQFRATGKDLFLLTNSGWEYTDAVMSHLLDDVLPGFSRWIDYFKVVVCSADKPGFFAGADELNPVPDAQRKGRAKVATGGSLRDLERALGVSGERILYIGDHIYGDILKSKKSSTWRTAMIIPEMASELRRLEGVRENQLKADRLFQNRLRLEVELNYQQRLLMSMMGVMESGCAQEGLHGPDMEEARCAGETNVAAIRMELEDVARELAATRRKVLAPFNPHWGMLFKEGAAQSMFGAQVEDYACLYTGKVSNFLSYSPDQYFRAARDIMPHETEL